MDNLTVATKTYLNEPTIPFYAYLVAGVIILLVFEVVRRLRK